MEEATTLLTGASGGIGQAIAEQLFAEGYSLILVARRKTVLDELKARLEASYPDSDAVIEVCAADLCSAADREMLALRVEQHDKPVNRLINNAGISSFALFEQESGQSLESIMEINALAPMQLTNLLLPYFKRQTESEVINVGSTFGSIAFPGFSAYSASKFALRGFSEALGRECHDSTLRIRYFAPRATRTNINSVHVEQMNDELKVAMDSSQHVAKELLRFIRGSKTTAHLGWPEKGFAKLNQLFPALVTHFISKDLSTIKRFGSAVNKINHSVIDASASLSSGATNSTAPTASPMSSKALQAGC
ncbi:MAG: SDR family oxidoreductase [Pseudomonadales bacterium]